MGRAIIIVLDSVGCGGAADAGVYGDAGADTLGHLAAACAEGKGDRAGLRTGALKLPHLDALGLGLAMAVALDATVVRIMLVPAAMRLFGDWNWWLPGPLERRLPRVALPK